jgi:Phosphotyrosine interaction domain (PTB/PID)
LFFFVHFSGDACMEKPLATLWRNYTQNNKPDVLMRLQVCPSGLKATTRQHGLTEYWAHRVTHCCAPKNYPKVFCWIYRHEGRRLKHELRCHAVICSKDNIAQEISTRLKVGLESLVGNTIKKNKFLSQENLATALREFKRDKISKQNARLSLANAVYDNPSMPRRKILLSVGANHYRPPLERSKSAPKLMAIEEIIGEEEEEEERESELHDDHQRVCCKEDTFYTSSTLGRRHCRRGHSLRRAKLRNSLQRKQQILRDAEKFDEPTEAGEVAATNSTSAMSATTTTTAATMLRSLSSESDDDFEEFLLSTNYNSKEPLSGEFISYLDMKLKPTTVSLHDLRYQPRTVEDVDHGRHNYDTLRNTMSLDDLNDFCSDADEEEDADDVVFYSHDHVMEVLNHQKKQFHHSISAPSSMATAAGQVKTDIIADDVSCPPSLICVANKLIGNLDSDEGSISSGCETSSTVTTVTMSSERVEQPKRCSVLERVRSFEQLAENNVNCVPVGEKRTPQPFSKPFQRSITFPGPGGLMRSNFNLPPPPIAAINKQLISQLENVDADSDVSDESGYVEFQENSTCKVKSIVT